MRLKNLLIITCAATSVWSCSKNDLRSQDGLMRVQIDVETQLSTRASATEQENTVSAFDVYLFDAESGLLEAVQQNVSPETTAPGALAGTQRIGEVTFPLGDNSKKNILAVANAGDNTVVMPEIEVGKTTYADMLEAVTVLAPDGGALSHPFVMGGFVNGADPAKEIAVSLCRRVTKITVSNQSEDVGLNITSLQLTGAVNQAYLFRDRHPSDADGLQYVDYGEMATSGSTSAFYVFPQPAATNAMKLTVKGTLNGNGFSQVVDICPVKDGTPKDMDHNTVYTVKLSAGESGLSAEVGVSNSQDWADGEDISGTITGGETPGTGLISFNGLQWMDRNLGATSADLENDWDNAIGAFYQWGRNTVFPAHNIPTVAGPLTAAAVAENGGKFITVMKGDWLSGTDNTRWQSASTQPCPEGYRMPTVAEFMGIFTTSGVLVTMWTPPTEVQENLVGGAFPAQYWGDKTNHILYGIKKYGSDDAYFMRWEWLTTAAGNNYVKISRWAAGKDATFTDKDLEAIRSEFEALGSTSEVLTLPAAGNITGSNGTYSAGSPGGYYWTSSLNGSEGAHRAEFTVNKMIAGDTYNSRVSGHSIRCVKE